MIYDQPGSTRKNFKTQAHFKKDFSFPFRFNGFTLDGIDADTLAIGLADARDF